MKILHTVEFYYPSVGGSQEVVRQLSEHLVMLGHDVTVATTKLSNRKTNILNGVKIREFEIYGNKVRGIGGNINSYKQFLLNNKFDVIMNYAAQQWASDIFFDVMDQITGVKVFVPCGFSGLYDQDYRKYFQALPEILRRYDATVYLSQNYRDINYARENKLKNTIVIPNGADEREFRRLSSQDSIKFRQNYGISDNELLLLHVGTHTGVKGHKEAIRAFLSANVKKATLMIAGDNNLGDSGCLKSCLRAAWLNNNIRNHIYGKNKIIQIVHLSRKDTVLAFQAADIFMFLSNIECSPLVLFESAAAGKPFIASECGNSKEIARWTGSGIIVKSHQDSVGYTVVDVASASQEIERLDRNVSRRKRMGKSGRTAWITKYSWDKISKKYEKLYLNLFKRKQNEKTN